MQQSLFTRKKHTITLAFILITFALSAQQLVWNEKGDAFWTVQESEITQNTLPDFTSSVVVAKNLLTPEGRDEPLEVESFAFSADEQKVLIYTNSQRVWRQNTRGDYWALDLPSKKLRQLGADKPASSLMFAKFSPDGTRVAYVSQHNIFVEDVASGKITQLTKDGTDKIINGTFDWAYEEEFGCRDGFRWSPDGKTIAYWQIDATDVKYFYMINTTDSIYSFTIPVEYPKVGETPSACKIGIVNANGGATKWLDVPGDNRQHYIPRMEWTMNSDEIMLQQLNRKQNHSKLFIGNVKSGAAKMIQEETDEAWINAGEWTWINDGKEFIWESEKDGWRHYYRIAKDGEKETLLTKGDYDAINMGLVDENSNMIYFIASPDNATERYLYSVSMDGKGQAKRITPAAQNGSHSYTFAPSGKYAFHVFSSTEIRPMREWVSLPDHKALVESQSIAKKMAEMPKTKPKVEFFQVTTESGVTVDGWMVKPDNFDPTLKYPVVFYVYTEPASQTVINRWGTGRNGLYNGDMVNDGYIYVSLDNRGTPAPKGRAWRKSIYRKIGIINIDDQAQAAKKVLAWDYIDDERVAVHGWSGGGSATLNLLFRYPEIYKTGIAVAAVADQLTYDNIYQERYMGIPQENREDFVAGSPITYAKNLEGNLLYIHGTGDDNVHYQNAERLINELIKYNKQFQVMPYPNRSHSIYEGEGTRQHLNTLFTNYLRTYCPPGGIAIKP